VGAAPTAKKKALSLYEWAIRTASKSEPEEAGKALRAWAKKNGGCQYARELLEAPEQTHEYNEYLRNIGRL